MNKSELIDRIAERSRLPRKKAEAVVNLLFDSMTDALASGERIEIRGFGSFVSKQYRARMGRNPRTGETIPVPAKRLPFFKVGKELRERVNSGYESPPGSGFAVVSSAAGGGAEGSQSA
jgi:integration host factor subunit beta